MKKSASSFIMATAFSRIGSLILMILYNYLVVAQGYSSTYLGIVNGFMFIPNFLLSFVSGIYADRFDNKTILLFCDTISMILCLFCYLWLSFISPNHIFTVGAVFITMLNSVAAIYGPVSRALVPKMVDQNNISKYNSIYTTVADVVKFVVPLIVGIPFMLNLKINELFMFNFLTFLVSFCFTLRVQQKKNFVSNSMVDVKQKKIFQIVKSEKVQGVIIVLFTINLCASIFNIYLPYLAKQYPSGLNNYPLFIGMQAFGALTMSMCLIFGKISLLKKDKLIYSISIMIVVYSVIFLINRNSLLVMICLFFLGSYISYFTINFYTIIQGEVTTKYLGKIFGIISGITLLAVPLGSFLAGYIINWFNSYLPIALAGFICFILFVLLISKQIKGEYSE